MPSDSIAGFLDRAQASRVLFPDQVEQLIRQPDTPQSDLASLCSYLLGRGVLTQFQADAIRDGRGEDLSFGGYPVIDMIGPCPGGTAYRILHPSLRTPLVLRRLDSAAFVPTDNANAVVQRARTIGSITHPNLLPVVDAGVYSEQAYTVLDMPADAADIASLLKEVGGAMPGFLAAEYGWAIASGLRVIHERGGWHGEVRPGLLFVGPVVIKTSADGHNRRRPAPNATVKLTEVGLIPVRPSANAAIASRAAWPGTEVLAFLPPERIESNVYEPRGDIYGLGASLYLLLAGRAPFSGDTPEEVANKVLTAEPAPLTAVRPDVQPELAAFVMRMIAKRPEDRPQTAFDVCEGLAKFCRPGMLPAAPLPTVVPHAVPQTVPQVVPHAVPHAVPVVSAAPAAPPEPDDWGVNPNAFADAHAASAADTKQPRRRQLTDADKSRSKMWIILGLCLHLSAVTLLIAWALGAFNSTPDPVPQTDPKEKKVEPQKNKDKNKNKNKKTDPERDPN
jgi:serine/threonine protein kinase